MTKEEALARINEQCRIARAALDKAGNIADENGVEFRFALYDDGYRFPYYPAFSEETKKRFEELNDKSNLTEEEYAELDEICDRNPPDDYNGDLQQGWWMPSQFC